jgi:hypothetical protein
MLTGTMMLLLVAAALGLAVIALVVATFFTVNQRTAAIVQRSGRSSRTSIGIFK